MLAAVFAGEGKLTLKDVEKPKITKPDEVLLEVECASICGTDVQILKVPPGHPATAGAILGHEYVGKVLEIGKEVTGFQPGDRVVIDPNITCGNCLYCKLGMPNMCSNMTTLGIFINGGFTKYNVAPAKQLHKISLDLPAEIAVFAEPLSCVVNAASKVKIQPGESVVILGAGPIGLLFTQLFKASGAGKIIVSEPTEFRAKFAQESGATRIVNPKGENLKDIVLQETGVGADVVVDAVGVLFETALSVIRKGGRVLLFGMNATARPQVAQYQITRNEIQILGTFISHYSFPQTIKILESGVLSLAQLITHRIKLLDLQQGIAAMRKGEAIEVVVTP